MDRSERIPVTGKGGWRGAMDPQPVEYAGAPHAVLHLEGSDPILVPADLVRRQRNGAYALDLTRDQLLRGSAPGQPVAGKGARTPGEELVVPVVVEEIDVQKRQWETGGVRVRMEVREREEVVDQPLVREEVRVERVPINQVVEAAPRLRQEGNTTVIPVLEEVLVVEKRLMLKEEVRITKRQFEAHEPQRVVLRSEEPMVERLQPDHASGAERDAA
jgi:uncharacterized protein (TIGR02271 family)